MAAPDNTGIQYTIYQGRTMINIYVPDADPAELAEDIEAKLDVVGTAAVKSAETAALLQATATAAGILGATAAPAASGAQGGSQSFGEQGPSCEHGPRQGKSGVSQKTGKPWRAWDCPQGVCPRQFRN